MSHNQKTFSKEHVGSEDVKIVKDENFQNFYATRALPIASRQNVVQISFLQENFTPRSLSTKQENKSLDIKMNLGETITAIAHANVPLNTMIQMIMGFFQLISKDPSFPQEMRDKILQEAKKYLSED